MPEPVLPTPERNEVRNVLARVSDFTDYGVRGRREFAVAAGLGLFLPGLVWEGSDRSVAGSFVDLLNRHGSLQERPAYHAVGALLAYLIAHPETSGEDKKKLAKLVVTHGLVKDLEYVQQLRSQYAIIEEPPESVQQPPPPERLAELAEQVQQPAFTPVVSDKERLERTRNSEDNFLDIVQLLGAIYSAEAVGLVQLSDETALGTGWLIGPDLLLTNFHVLPTHDYVADASVRFGYRKDVLNVRYSDGRTFKLVPEDYYTSPVEELDYALVRLQEAPLADMMIASDQQSLSLLELIRLGQHRGYLLPVPRNLLNLQQVNIIQHPGRFKGEADPVKAVLTQNYVTADMRPTRVHYTADTRPGSSGSPVFNVLWEVVALHHSGDPEPPIPGIRDVNEGIPMKAILKDLETRRTEGGQRLISLLPRLA